MRQVISWRFVAADRRARSGWPLFVYVAFGDRRLDRRGRRASRPTPTRRADLVVDRARDGPRRASPCRRAASRQGDADDAGAPGRARRPAPVTVFPGTPGEVTCADLDKPCALLAETLGDTIMWFALVPMGPNFQFELPAIESLDGGYAHLVNGWQVPLRPGHRPQPLRLSRPSRSREFLRLVGPAHRALYDLGTARDHRVVC